MQFFSVRVVLARPMVDVLKRRRADGSGNEVVQYGVPLQYGGRYEEEACSWVDGFKFSAEESAISEELFNEKATVLVVAKTGVRSKKTKMQYACLERGTHGKEDATVRLFCNEKGVDMQVQVAAWQFMIFDKDADLVDMEYAEALANLHLSNMAAEDMITRIGTENTEV